jgi:hypothetical protein
MGVITHVTKVSDVPAIITPVVFTDVTFAALPKFTVNFLEAFC